MVDTSLKGRKLETRMCYRNPDENNDGHFVKMLRSLDRISLNYKLFIEIHVKSLKGHNCFLLRHQYYRLYDISS